jgi:hypothetical protein
MTMKRKSASMNEIAQLRLRLIAEGADGLGRANAG